ncbi:hypothetical protein SALWKB2_0312 [Snodgrassella alvi wkB2]|nr:hypothetical protein SALWKB2_0312 [Snodgrassella alvi wkB2]
MFGGKFWVIINLINLLLQAAIKHGSLFYCLKSNSMNF